MNRSRENLPSTISADWLCQLYPLRSTCESHVAAQLSRTLSGLKMITAFKYVGPQAIVERSAMNVPRQSLNSKADVFDWIKNTSQELDAANQVTATYIVDLENCMWIADRHSEHVVCARGNAVLGAGEITLMIEGKSLEITEISNQSTGYCPKPSCWTDVSKSLTNAGLRHPKEFTLSLDFRRCKCGQINIIKNQLFECAVCGSKLPDDWNFHHTQDAR